MKNLSMILLVMLFCFGCKKSDTTVKTNGVVVMSSQILGADAGFYVAGYSFAQASVVNYNLTSSTVPDILIENNVDNQGTTIGGNLTSPKNDTAFALAGEFSSAAEAETFFNGLTTFTSPTFTSKADNVLKNQVYLFKSRSNTYAKCWIQDISLKTGTSSGYVEITIKWVYQPDGSMTFPASLTN